MFCALGTPRYEHLALITFQHKKLNKITTYCSWQMGCKKKWRKKKVHKIPARLIHCNIDSDLIQTMHNALTPNNRWLLWAVFSYLGILSNDYSCKQAFCLKLITELFWLVCWFQLQWRLLTCIVEGRLRKVEANSRFQKALGTEMPQSVSEAVRNWTISGFLLPPGSDCEESGRVIVWGDICNR